MFKPTTIFYSDGYKVGHKRMLAKGTTRLYGTGIPRSTKYCPKGVTKIVSFGQQLAVRWLHDEFQENFFKQPLEVAKKFGNDMSEYLSSSYDSSHFEELHKLGYLPIQYQSLPEGIETNPNIPHSTFINTKEGFGWLTLYLETIISSLTWKSQVSATISLHYKRRIVEWVMKTDPSQSFLIPYLACDFSARGGSPFDMISVGLGHATSLWGSDTLIAIPAARYFYDEPENEVIISSVNASEHSVTCTNIFFYEDELKSGKLNDKIKEYYSFDLPCDGSVENPDYIAIAEWLMLSDWLDEFPEGILSYVCDTFNTWKSVTHIVARLKEKILKRNGKLVLRPDSGDPVDIICGREYVEIKDVNSLYFADSPNVVFCEKTSKFYETNPYDDGHKTRFNLKEKSLSEIKGVIELLWDIFGGTTNEQGYKVLDSHIGAIYGDSITYVRQEQIYQRLEKKKFASTNIVLGIGSFTYILNTRDTTGYAIKGAWFEIDDKGYNIYKDPITDDGTKKSLKGFQFVYQDEKGEYQVEGEVSEFKAYSKENLLRTIYKDGKFYNQTTFKEIRERINVLSNKF
jgi:nicotinamide phosphoribosyltransferase